VYFYAPLGPFWTLAGGKSERTERAPVAGGSGSDLRPGEEKQSAAQAGEGHACDVSGDTGSTVALQGMDFSGRLNTAFIERVNLSIRHGVTVLACRTWATAKLPHNCWLIWNGGGLTNILCTPMQRYGWRSCSRESEVASWHAALLAAYTSFGSGENQSTMDNAGSAVLSSAAVPSFKLWASLKRENSPRNGSGWLGEDKSRVGAGGLTG
jgi:hypothetical protein